MARRIFWAVFGVAAVVLVIMAAVAVGLTELTARSATRTELARAAGVVAQVVEEQIDSPAALRALVDSSDNARLQQRLDDLRRAAGGSDITLAILRPNGELVSQRELPSIAIDTAALRDGEPVWARVPREGANDVLVLARPGARLGPGGSTLVLLLSREVPVDPQLSPRVLIVPLLIVAAIALAAASLIAKGFKRRLDSVAQAAESVSRGRLSARATVSGHDELTEVASTFNEMADQLQDSRDRERQFLLAVGHDLRTPLTTISGYAEALQDGIDDPDEVKRIAGVLDVQGTRLRRLIEDVMLLARLDSAEFTLRPEPVDVTAHLDGVLEGFEDRAGVARVSLVRQLEYVGDRSIDPDRLGQVLGNLVENALRYTPETGSVTVGLHDEGPMITLHVADTGPGIEPADLPRIFERFYVAQKYRGVRPEGSGLGLSIVHRLVTAMGGEITARSAPGAGTTVEVRIPANST